MNTDRRGVCALASIGALITVAVTSSPGVIGATGPRYSLANVGAYGGEPSIVSDHTGRLYDTTPSGGTLTYTSTNHRASWSQVTTAHPNSGDDCLPTHQAKS